MSTEKKSRRGLYSLAAAVGLALGSMGVAAAVTAPSQPAATVAAAQQPASTEAANGTATADEAPEGAEADGVQEPTLNGSIQAPESETASEADEATALEGLATISPSDAESAALAAVPGGTVDSIELDNENGSVVYQVGITDAGGQVVEVKVDAGNGDVLATEIADDEGESAGESESGESDEVEAPGDEDTDGVDHEFEGEEVGNNGDGIPDADDATEASQPGTGG